MATGKVPLVYMQNSGLGNATNPLLSLADPEVYRIPMVLLIGWRGQPGVHDEPQHVKQGRITCSLLDTMEIPYSIIDGDTDACRKAVESCRRHLETEGSPYAFVVRKDSFSEYVSKPVDSKDYPMTREEAIDIIAAFSEDQIIVSTTGLASRELYEIRDARKEGHGSDFLTVGSMGHSSQIALSMALSLPGRRIVCIDGDGAAIMHMGGMATLASQHPGNLVHVVINNGVHDSVGGQPTVSREIDMHVIAEAMGYRSVRTVETREQLREALAIEEGPVFIQVMVRRGTRKDIGRPRTTPAENKAELMDNIRRGTQ